MFYTVEDTVEDPGFAPGGGEGLKGPLTAKRVARKSRNSLNGKMASLELKMATFKPKKVPEDQKMSP